MHSNKFKKDQIQREIMSSQLLCPKTIFGSKVYLLKDKLNKIIKWVWRQEYSYLGIIKIKEDIWIELWMNLKRIKSKLMNKIRLRVVIRQRGYNNS